LETATNGSHRDTHRRKIAKNHPLDKEKTLKSLNTLADKRSLQVLKRSVGGSRTAYLRARLDDWPDCSVLARANSDHYCANDDLLPPSLTRTICMSVGGHKRSPQHQTIQRVSDSIKRSRQELFSTGWWPIPTRGVRSVAMVGPFPWAEMGQFPWAPRTRASRPSNFARAHC